MALKFRYAKKDEVPGDVAAFYAERDGAWLLDVDGAAEKAKLDEFRSNNLALIRERDELKQRFEGIDPDEVKRLAGEKQRLEDEQKLKAGEFDKVLDTRIKAARAELEKQLGTLVTERDALNGRLSAIQIDQGVMNAATKRGLRSTALPDITARARSVFRLVQGVPVSYEADGATVRVGKDGSTPMTLEEWIDTQVSEAPHLFEGNVGGGGGAASNGSGGAGGRAVRNPFRKETWNLTAQMQLAKTDPQLAARLKASA